MTEKFESTPASSQEKSALELQQHIKGYIPKIWKETIGTVAHTPIINQEVVIQLREAYKKGELAKFLINWRDGRYNKWYFMEAIEDYFAAKNKEK